MFDRLCYFCLFCQCFVICVCYSNLIFDFFSKYETLACNILSRCRDNPGVCKPTDLLTRVMPNWGDVTCLNIAESAWNMNFLSHSVVKEYLNKKWYGKIAGDNVLRRSYWQFLLEPFWVNLTKLKCCINYHDKIMKIIQQSYGYGTD